MKYRHKPVEVEAIQYTGNNKEEIIEFTKGNVLTNPLPNHSIIVAGDWIIKEGNKFHLLPSEIFEKTYELLE